jgi:uncharacterized repeat protein (TIGR01451 family)
MRIHGVINLPMPSQSRRVRPPMRDHEPSCRPGPAPGADTRARAGVFAQTLCAAGGYCRATARERVGLGSRRARPAERTGGRRQRAAGSRNHGRTLAVETGPAGQEMRRWEPAGRLSAGDELHYTVRVTNPGKERVTDIVVTKRLPFGVQYIRGSAVGPACTVQFSIDGGLTFAEPKQLEATKAKGAPSGKRTTRKVSPANTRTCAGSSASRSQRIPRHCCASARRSPDGHHSCRDPRPRRAAGRCLARVHVARAADRHGGTRGGCTQRASAADRRSRHRHRQDVRVPGAGADLRPPGHRVYGHARTAGPAVSPRPAHDLRCAWTSGARRIAQGSCELPVPASTRCRRAAGLYARAQARSGHGIAEGAGLVAHDPQGRHRGIAEHRRTGSRVAVGDVDARELPGR